jgi:ABC-2 type transport system permease protein
LCLTFSDIKISSSDKGLLNLVYFLVLFTSNSLYPVSSFNEKIANLANFLPLNPILSLLRSETFMFYHLAFWAIIPVILFYFLYKRLKVVR